MEVIQEISKLDINSSLMRVKKNLTKNIFTYKHLIDSAENDLKLKEDLLDEFQEKLILYNKILTVLAAMVNEYCTNNKMTTYIEVMREWIDIYKTPWECTTNNIISDKVRLISDDEEDIHIKVEKYDCSQCHGCQACNSRQSICEKSFTNIIGCQRCDSCQGCFNSCQSGYSFQGGGIEACISGYNTGTCYGGFSSCQSGFNIGD